MSSPTLALQAPAVAPRKLFYRIHEVAQMTGLKPHVLRYWETEFRELAPPKDSSDQRRYRPSDIEVVLAIRKLLYEDRFTIEGARKRLREELRRMRRQAHSDEEPAPPPVNGRTATAQALPALPPDPSREALRRSLGQLRREVAALIELLNS